MEENIFKNPDKELLSKFKCPICWRIVENPVQDQHGHVFCKVCITYCLEYNHQCPICKEPLNKNNLYEISLGFKN